MNWVAVKREQMTLDGLPDACLKPPSDWKPQQKETQPMAKPIGPKEQQRRQLREQGVGAPKKSAAKAVHGLAAINAAVIAKAEHPTAKEEAAGQTMAAMIAAVDDSKRTDQPPAPPAEESDMQRKKTPTKKTAKTKARTAVKGATTSTRPDGLRKDSKQADMIDMVLRDEGATHAAMCKKLGWKKCLATLHRVAKKAGVTIEQKQNVRKETVFYGTMKKKA